MKRVGNLYCHIHREDNLKLAYLKAAKGKSKRSYVLEFRQDIQANMMQLQQQLINHECDIGNYRFFYVVDPKVRRICEASFQERVLQHAVMNVCGEYIERGMISDSYACRKHMGTHKCLKKTLQNSRINKWYLKLDIRKFFDSVNHEILLFLYQRIFKDRELLGFFAELLDTYQTLDGCGLPLGGLFSQYSANFYLNGLDHFIKETLKVKCYVRYMDDFILWGDSPEQLNNKLSAIVIFLNDELNLTLKNDIQLNQTMHGIPFLGYRIFPWGLRLKKESLKRFIKKLAVYEKKYAEKEIDEDVLAMSVRALAEFAKKGTNISFRNEIFKKYSIYS